MVEILARGRKKIVPERPFKRHTTKRVENERPQNRVAQDLDGMLVKRGHHFNACRRVVQLVKHPPKSIRVSKAMPPIEEERADDANEKLILELQKIAAKKEALKLYRLILEKELKKSSKETQAISKR